MHQGRETGGDRLRGRTALVAVGDSGLGGAAALALAGEGAAVALAYFNDHRAAEAIRQSILRGGSRCILMSGDAANASFCRFAVRRTLGEFGRLDILVNDACRRQPQGGKWETGTSDIRDSFRTNLLGMFHLTAAAVPHLENGGVIINSASTTATRTGAAAALAAATTDATLAFTRCLAQALDRRRIRVDAVATNAPASGHAAGDAARGPAAMAAGDRA